MMPVSFKFVCGDCGRVHKIEARVTETVENPPPAPPAPWKYRDGLWWCGECTVKPIEGEVLKQ